MLGRKLSINREKKSLVVPKKNEGRGKSKVLKTPKEDK